MPLHRAIIVTQLLRLQITHGGGAGNFLIWKSGKKLETQIFFWICVIKFKTRTLIGLGFYFSILGCLGAVLFKGRDVGCSGEGGGGGCVGSSDLDKVK